MKLFLLTCVAAGIVWAQSKDLIQQAPAKFSARPNPMEANSRARLAGAKLYARECAACHGVNGEGSDKAPALKRLEVSNASPGALFWVLENGALHQGMPSFAHLPEAQRWQIIAYLRSLAPKED